jgi:hypothetical protein
MFSEQTILLATIGQIGVIATPIVLIYGFIRSPRGV